MATRVVICDPAGQPYPGADPVARFFAASFAMDMSRDGVAAFLAYRAISPGCGGPNAVKRRS